MSFQLGDMVKKVLAPFVKGTEFENCKACDDRRIALNKVSTGVANFVSRWIAKITCPCFWRGLFNKSK